MTGASRLGGKSKMVQKCWALMSGGGMRLLKRYVSTLVISGPLSEGPPTDSSLPRLAEYERYEGEPAGEGNRQVEGSSLEWYEAAPSGLTTFLSICAPC